MTKEDFDALVVGTVEQRDLQIRQVSNGYEFKGNRRFLDANTMTEKFSIGSEGVAETSENALAAIQRFYTNGDF